MPRPRDRRERLACLDQELASIAHRLHEIEEMDSQVDRRIRSADNIDTALLKIIGFFGQDSTTGRIVEEIRHSFVMCQFLKED